MTKLLKSEDCNINDLPGGRVVARSDSQVQAGQVCKFFYFLPFAHVRKPDMDIFRLALDIAQVPTQQGGRMYYKPQRITREMIENLRQLNPFDPKQLLLSAYETGSDMRDLLDREGQGAFAAALGGPEEQMIAHSDLACSVKGAQRKELDDESRRTDV
jgi:hypothetical protein